MHTGIHDSCLEYDLNRYNTEHNTPLTFPGLLLHTEMTYYCDVAAILRAGFCVLA